MAGGGNASPFGQIMPCAGSGPARLVVTHRGRDSPARLCSFRFRAAPALLAFAAEAGAFAALGGQHAGVAGVGITPAQARPAACGPARGDSGGPGRPWQRCVPDRTAPRSDWPGIRSRGVKHSPAFSRLAQRRIAGVLFAAPGERMWPAH